MKLNELKPSKGSVKKNKRLGRGEGSGASGTASRGHKGAQSRSGYSRKRGFEGGQMPLQRRVPKFGFNNPNKVYFKIINLSTLEKLASDKAVSEVTQELLVQSGLVSKKDKVKILGHGELTAKLSVSASAFSEKARTAIESAGGQALVIA
ncbi:MAG: 50S ribosomal protein L15 [Flavobacteriales bacterium]|nr:50S ribosomal protein L15 [Flavobacteriales bacterium]